MTQNTYDGKLYAVGATESSVAFYYNKDYLKECGVDTDDLDSRTLENPLTTDEVAEIAEKCTTDDYVGTHIIMDHAKDCHMLLNRCIFPLEKIISAKMEKKPMDM